MIDVNNYLSVQVHGAAGSHNASDGVTATIDTVLTFLESLIGLTPSEMFTNVLPGVSSMANIHPLVVHFPIAFLLAFFVVDLIGTLIQKDNLRQLAGGLLYLGTISAAAAVVAGLVAESTVEHGENVHLIIERHEFFGISVLCLSIVLSIWRFFSKSVINGGANLLFLMLAAMLNVFIVLGADLGGLMVYKHGVAVEAVEITSMNYFHEHTHKH